jgi:hypothetical protein
MTQSELLELSELANSNMLAAFTIFITLASGYLIVAYLVGEKLARSQLWFINAIFVLTMVVVSFAIHYYIDNAQMYVKAARELGDQGGPVPPTYQSVVVITYLIDAFILIGCLKFMWDVRHTD